MAETLMGRRPTGRGFRDAAMAGAIWGGALLVTGVFCWLLGDLLWHGAGRLNWSFLIAPPANAGRSGGIGPILASTLLIVAIAIAVAAPLALATAALLTEFLRPTGRTARLIGLSLDALAGTPSIVFGLFGNAFFCVWLGLGFSILSGGLTLACMALPILIRTTEAGLRMASDDWRRGAAALGLSRSAALWRILIPAAAPAMTAGLILGVGRAMAEADSYELDDTKWNQILKNVAGGDRSAYASALVLIALLLIVNSAAMRLMDRLFSQRIVTQ